MKRRRQRAAKMPEAARRALLVAYVRRCKGAFVELDAFPDAGLDAPQPSSPRPE